MWLTFNKCCLVNYYIDTLQSTEPTYVGSELKMQFQVEDSSPSLRQLQRMANCKTHKLKSYRDTDRNANCKELGRNYRYLKSRIASDN